MEACGFGFEAFTLLLSLRKILSAHLPKKSGLIGDSTDEASGIG
jgi:hypothetical protein